MPCFKAHVYLGGIRKSATYLLRLTHGKSDRRLKNGSLALLQLASVRPYLLYIGDDWQSGFRFTKLGDAGGVILVLVSSSSLSFGIVDRNASPASVSGEP